MRRSWGENVGGRAKRLGAGLAVIVILVVVSIIVMLPRRASLLPRHFSPFTSSSVTGSSTATTTSTSLPTHSAVTADHNAPWDRLATFYVLTGHKDHHYMSTLLAETLGGCRSLSTNTTSSMCQRSSDVYLLYSNNDELQAAKVAVNATRYSNQFVYFVYLVLA